MVHEIQHSFPLVCVFLSFFLFNIIMSISCAVLSQRARLIIIFLFAFCHFLSLSLSRSCFCSLVVVVSPCELDIHFMRHKIVVVFCHKIKLIWGYHVVIIIDEDQIVWHTIDPPHFRSMLLFIRMLVTVNFPTNKTRFISFLCFISVIVSNALIFMIIRLVSLNFRCQRIVDGTGVIVFIKWMGVWYKIRCAALHFSCAVRCERLNILFHSAW